MPAGLHIEIVAEIPLMDITVGDVGVALTVTDAHDVNVRFATYRAIGAGNAESPVQAIRIRGAASFCSCLNAGVVINEPEPELVVDIRRELTIRSKRKRAISNLIFTEGKKLLR